MKLKITVLLLLAASTIWAQGKAPKPPKHPRTAMAQRRAWIEPAELGQLKLTPTYTSLSVAWGMAEPRADITLEYRLATSPSWQAVPVPPYAPDVQNYRGSITELAEDTVYEVRVRAGDKIYASQTTRTWKTNVPIARDVEIDPATAHFPIVLSDHGTPEGWIRYRVKKGTILHNTSTAATIAFTNAAYVILADSTLRGGYGIGAITICDSRHIRILNCDIADFGNGNVLPRYDQLGGLFGPWNATKKRYVPGNHCGGIDVTHGAEAVTIERCWIHDAHSRAHSWRYSHPYGPMAIRFRDPEGNFVVRWCDCVGSDNHRWDDGIGGGTDFAENGLFHRDSDVEGNFVFGANDDCLEIDGGQQNIRVMRNRFEQGYMGLSVQGCTVGPSYSYDNAFTGCGEEFGMIGAPVKTSGVDLFNWQPHVFIYNNRFLLADAQHTIKTNKMTAIFHLSGNRYDVHPRDAWWAAYPRRNLPWALDTGRLTGIRVQKGVVSPQTCSFVLTCGGQGYVSPFTLAKNLDADWFDVTPTAGTIRSGETITFTVTFHADKMQDRRHKRAAFLVRTPEGLSRPVSVYADTDYLPPVKPEKPGETALYASLNATDPYQTYTFTVPKKGRYYFMIRGQRNTRKIPAGIRTSLRAVIDGGEEERAPLRFADYPGWHILSPSGTYMSFVRFYDFAAGTHTITLIADKGNEYFTLEGLVLTDAPGSFEPR